jgi:hypothetical protein
MDTMESKTRCWYGGKVGNNCDKQAGKRPSSRQHLRVGEFFITIVLRSLLIVFLSAVALLAVPSGNSHASGVREPYTADPASITSTSFSSTTANPGIAQSQVVGQGTNCIDGTIINSYGTLQGGEAWSISIKTSTTPGVILDQGTANTNGSFHFPSSGKPMLGAGTYIVALTPPDGWQPITPTEFSVTLTGNANVNCARVRFKMEALANLIVTKLDSGGRMLTGSMAGIPDWKFTATPKDNPNGVIQTAVTDGLGNAYFLNLPPGVWEIKEEQKNGWLLAAGYTNPQVITLVSPQRSGNPQKLTFVNTQVKADWILVEKKDTLGNPLPGWKFTLTSLDGKRPPQIGITNKAGQYYFQGLLPGKWLVVETPQNPWWRSVSPNSQVVTLSPPNVGQAVEFINEPLGCVAGYKINQLEKALPGWTIKAHKTSGDTTDQTAVTDSKGYFQFYLSLGTWTFSEVMQDGWSAVTPAKFSVPVTKQFKCEHVRFKNRTDYACVDAYKLDAFYGSGLSKWQISIQPAYGGAVQTALTDGTGWVRFNKLIPGQYIITEIFSATQASAWRSVGVTVDAAAATSPAKITLTASGSCRTVKFMNRQNK